MYQGSLFLTLALAVGLSSCQPQRKSKPEDLIATDSQIQFSDTNGEFKSSVNTDNSFRAESRQPDGSVKGVYGWIAPDGKPVQVAFKSDAQNGYQTFSDVEDLEVNLPPLPSKLYESQENESLPSPRENILPRQRYRLPESRSGEIFQAEEDDDNFIILEDEEGSLVREGGEDSDDDSAVFLEGDGVDEAPSQGTQNKIAFIEGYEELLSDLRPGTPVAQSNPSVSSIAGEFGVAQADPRSSSIVGPGGVAISLPKVQALVGPGGISISAPKSSSQAGPGGIAIASVHSTSVAGIQSDASGISGDDVEGPGGDPGFFKRDAALMLDSLPIRKGAAAPFITNYFFQFRLPEEYYGAADLNQVREKFYYGPTSGRSRVVARRRSVAPRITSRRKAGGRRPERIFSDAPDLQSLSQQA